MPPRPRVVRLTCSLPARFAQRAPPLCLASATRDTDGISPNGEKPRVAHTHVLTTSFSESRSRLLSVRLTVQHFQVSYLCRCACLHRADRRADSCRQLQTEAKPQKLWVGVWSCVIKACKMLFYVVFTPFTAHPKNPNHTPALVASFHQRLRWGLQTAAQAAGPVVR